MADFTVLNPKWNNDKIIEAFNINDSALNRDDRFYYITDEGRLAYLETKATNTAETIAKVFYTLGLLNSDREAKEPIACGILCGSKHMAEICNRITEEDKMEAVQQLKSGIDELFAEMDETVAEINAKIKALGDLLG